MTRQQQYADHLLICGETEILGKSMKYRVFTRRQGGFYYLGRAGALRAGHTIQSSIPVKFKAREGQ